MNYAWSNPSTGMREQSRKSSAAAMLAESKLQVWLELQNEPEETADCQIWKQEAIGNVTVDGPAIDPGKAPKDTTYSFAWTDPDTGRRQVSESFPSFEVVAQLKALQENRDSKDEVIVYATWPECTIRKSDPRPESPIETEPFVIPPSGMRPGDSPEIQEQREALESVVVIDDSTKLAKVTAWALLDISQTLRESVAELRYPIKRYPKEGLWKRFKLWIFGDPEDPRQLCQSCGLPMEGQEICQQCAWNFADKSAPFLRPDTQAEELERFDRTWNAVKTKCATEEENEFQESSSAEQATKRAAVVAGRGPAPVVEPRPVLPTEPHIFQWGTGIACQQCGKPEGDAIHGYVGD